MIKTFNINLAGQVFNINEDAYEQLSAYFNSLRTFYANEADKEEIIRDIESRFAELFLAKGKNYIITKEDATQVINTMGNPQDFDGENQQENASSSSSNSQQTHASSGQTMAGKRLYRDFDNGLITGVCAGLSAYFGISDPIWLRLLFIILTFVGVGSPVLVYIILSLIMPKAETSAQKLEMRGEPINLSNIEKKIKDEADNISTMSSKNGKGFFYRLLDVFVKIISLLVKVFIAILRVIGIIIASLLLLTVFIVIIAFIIFTFVGTPAANRYFFDNSYDVLWISAGGLILLSTIFVFFALILYRRLYNADKQILRKLIFPIIGFFLFGLLLLNIGGSNIQKMLAEKKRINQTFPLNYGYKSDTLQLTINPTVRDEEYEHVNINGVSELMDFIADHNDKFFPVEIEVYPSVNDSFVVVKEYSASGRTDREAIKNATSFSHNITQVNNKLIIDPYIQFNNTNTKFRNQKLKIKVYVPEGKIIRWDARTEKYMDVDKFAFNWDNVRNAAPPIPPVPPIPGSANHKIEIKTSKNGDSTSSKIVINIDSDNDDVNAALDKAQEKLDEAREKLEDAQDRAGDSLDIIWENRLQRQHYIFKMINGELVAID